MKVDEILNEISAMDNQLSPEEGAGLSPEEARARRKAKFMAKLKAERDAMRAERDWAPRGRSRLRGHGHGTGGASKLGGGFGG